MFRANRIGTPNISGQYISSTTAIGAGVVRLLTDVPYFAVINATPDAEYKGHTFANGDANLSIAALRRAGIGQQFTVTQPLAGQVVGVEVVGSVYIGQAAGPAQFVMEPYACKLEAAGAGTWSIVHSDGFHDAFLDYQHTQQNTNAAAGSVRAITYKTQILFDQLEDEQLGGTYLHGILITNPLTGAATIINQIYGTFAVRQLQQLETFGYRDPLR